MEEPPELEAIADCIVVLRGQRVMLDADLALLYGVLTKRLNQQVRRNPGRFPPDFAFQLSAAEWAGTNRLQIASGLQRTNRANRSQSATGSQKHRGPAALPIAFTEGAFQVLLDEIRRLTQFPEAPKRGIGFTAPWPEEK